MANHHSHLDTPLLLSSIPEPWRNKMFVGAAADYFFGTPLTSALSALAIGAIPIERSKVSRRGADQAADLIDDGWSLTLFPEGGRSPDGWGQEFRGGAAYLALRCDVPVVPVHIAGTGKILGKGMKLPQARPHQAHLRSPDGRRRGRVQHAPSTNASRPPSPPWPTSPPPTGGPPASGSTPARPRRSPAPTPPPGAGPGPSATRKGRARQRRRWPKV